MHPVKRSERYVRRAGPLDSCDLIRLAAELMARAGYRSARRLPLYSATGTRGGRDVRRLAGSQPQRLSERVRAVPPSGIRKFFDVIATMPDVISLGVGEPDFTTPTADRRRGRPLAALRPDALHQQLRHARAAPRAGDHLDRLYGLALRPRDARSASPSARPRRSRRRWRPSSTRATRSSSTSRRTWRTCRRSCSTAARPCSCRPAPSAASRSIRPRLRRRSRRARKVLFLGYPCNPTGAVLDAETLRRARRHRQRATTCWWSATRSTTGSSTATTATRPQRAPRDARAHDPAWAGSRRRTR